MTNTLDKKWLEIDPNPCTRAEIKNLVDSNDESRLSSLMSPRIAFGTAGLRLEMAAGFVNMNDVTVMQASQGLVSYVKTGPIVIGYDHRHHSRRFAEITAAVALSKGFTVYYLAATAEVGPESQKIADGDCGDMLAYSEGGLVPPTVGGRFGHTPLVPFAIDTLGASCGVMVTALHNPAKDNGYKVYYGNGCQIIPPVDSGIAEAIDANLEPWGKLDVAKAFEDGLALGLLKPCLDEIQQKYVEKVSTLVPLPELPVKFVYTPMHGVGLDIVNQTFPKVFKGYQMEVVAEQAKPDPRFPTVSFPNPEERGALDLAMETARKSGIDLVIANDPDADRFSAAVAVKDGSWRQLTGNELGFLFAMYVIDFVVGPDQASNTYLVNSTVLSQILKLMAKIDGFHYVDTLTGFKWIGNKAIDLEAEGYRVPFAYEEAIGFMFPTAHDKDGVAAATVFLQLYNYYKGDVLGQLERGYEKYGYYKECNGYYRVPKLSLTNTIFSAIRASRSDVLSPIGDFEVKTWRDLTTGYQSDTLNNVPDLPVDSLAQMITAVLKDKESGDEVRFTARGLGTEPKVKVYIEGNASSEKAASDVAKKCWSALRQEWFKPEEYGLTEVV